MNTPAGRFESELDLALHLLDRQVQDAEDALVGKVDDVELTRADDGALVVSGLLLGANALLPRLWRRGHVLGSAPPAPPLDPTRVRLTQLLGGRVTHDGRPAGRVIDVRARPEEGRGLVVSHLVAGRGGAGSMLGYDRTPDMGPWAVAAIVRLLHRSSYVVDVSQCAIDWTDGSVSSTGHRTPIAEDREQRRVGGA